MYRVLCIVAAVLFLASCGSARLSPEEMERIALAEKEKPSESRGNRQIAHFYSLANSWENYRITGYLTKEKMLLLKMICEHCEYDFSRECKAVFFEYVRAFEQTEIMPYFKQRAAFVSDETKTVAQYTVEISEIMKLLIRDGFITPSEYQQTWGMAEDMAESYLLRVGASQWQNDIGR